MAVLLSPVGGVAGQFFDNNGNPLTGGKMYSYVAGTTTPQATYTSSAGTVAHSNPIILDAGGRVPGGEIWLTDGLQYKFVLKNANDVLIGTYDNIIGINSNFVNFLTETEVQTATASQIVFTLTTMQYQPGTNNLTVYVDGVNQIDGSTYSYVETSSTVITFTAGLHVGALVKFTTAQTLSTGVTDASLVTYDPPFTGSVTTTVEAKLAQTVSVKDFGAVGDGVTDDTVEIQAALDYVFNVGGGTVFFPAGVYKVSTLSLNWGTAGTSIVFKGAGENATVLMKSGSTTTPILSLSATLALSDGVYSTIEDMKILGLARSSNGIEMTGVARFVLRRVHIFDCDVGLYILGSLIGSLYDCDLNQNNTGIKTRKAGVMYCNLIAMINGSVRGNSTWGLDISEANAFNCRGTDIELNGTSGNTATGQLVVRAAIADEIGYANMSFNSCWFEAGQGTNILVESPTQKLVLSFSDVPMIASEAGRVLVAGSVNKLVLERVIAGTPGDTVDVSATTCVIRDSIINTITDASLNKDYKNLSTSLGLTQSLVTGVTGTYINNGNAVNSGGGSVATTSGVAATLFTANLSISALYEVTVVIAGLGSGSYMATARIVTDTVALVRLGGEDGANISITVSGANVQVTQISGAPQAITYFYQKIG